MVVHRTLKGNYVLSELDGSVHSQLYAAFRLLTYISREDPVLKEDNHLNDLQINQNSDVPEDRILVQS